MRTLLHHVSRDFEDYVLGLIGDYAGSWCFVDSVHPICRLQSGAFHRLRFNVTKRRHLGRVFVERISPEVGVLERKWLHSSHWQPSYDIQLLLCCKGLQASLRSLCPLVNVRHLKTQIQVCKKAMNEDAILVL